MRITNVENWRHEVEVTMNDTFCYVDTTCSSIKSRTGFTVLNPIQVKKENELWITIEVLEDGSLVMWDENWGMFRFMDVTAYRNKLTMLCDLTKNIMVKDKYCTMY